MLNRQFKMAEGNVDAAEVRVHVVMPVRGRREKSVEAMKRLKETAGYKASYVAIAGGADQEILQAMAGHCTAIVHLYQDSLTYWQALHLSTKALPDDTYVVNVANDIIPAVNWLRRAVDYVNARPEAVIGFNGDGYDTRHACHFMISMKQVRAYGGWPVWYHHNFGDTEIITRAIEDGLFHKDPWAILFHDHPNVSGSQTDDVYRDGSRKFNEDMKLFEKRRGNKWKH
jgi:hypothetical protein